MGVRTTIANGNWICVLATVLVHFLRDQIGRQPAPARSRRRWRRVALTAATGARGLPRTEAGCVFARRMAPPQFAGTASISRLSASLSAGPPGPPPL